MTSQPKRNRLIPVFLSSVAALSLAARPASADQAMLVSFSWSVSGEAHAAASLFPCRTGCFPIDRNTPEASFAEGGSALVSDTRSFQARAEVQYACSDPCNEMASGWSSARADLQMSAPSSSGSTTAWWFGAVLSTNVSASTTPGGSASADNRVEHEWLAEFVLEAPVTRLTMSRTHAVNIYGNAGSPCNAWSRMRLDDGTTMLYEQVLSGTEGGTYINGSGTTELLLGPGRYWFRISSMLDADRSAPPNSDGIPAQIAATVGLTFRSYACPAIISQPSDFGRCVLVPGAIAYFWVTASGDEVVYRWRRNGENLSDGPTACGSTVSGATTRALSFINISHADAGVYDCVVSNACRSVASEPARLTVGIPGDANNDGYVTFADVNAVLTNYGASYAPCSGAGDANRDGVVGFADITTVLTNFGARCL